MKRKAILAFAIAASLTGAAIPIGSALVLSWIGALRTEQGDLGAFNERLLQRAELVTAGATDAMRLIAVSPLPACSEAHVDEMRRIAINNRFIDGLGYFENGRLRCSSWGFPQKEIRPPPADFVTAEGIGVVRSIRPQMLDTDPRISMYLGSYDVLINPARFIDQLTDNTARVAVASDTGIVIATQNDPDPVLVTSLLTSPRPGLSDGYVYNALTRGGWSVVSMRPRNLLGPQRREALTVPLAVVSAAVVIGLVGWLTRQRLSPQGELAAAVRAGQLFMLYQPVIALSTGACIGAEALVRWRRDDGTVVGPDEFIPIAEESELITTITERVVAMVLTDLGSILAAGPAFHVGINLSAQDVRTGRILDILRQALQERKIAPGQIWLEMTETGFVAIEKAREMIIRAREAGHPVAIDDFGTGYSGLQYLQDLPLSALKIAKTFLDTIGLDTAVSSVTPQIIQMARTLGLVCVAEGIETPEQYRFLAESGVEYGQGWLFSRPIPAEEVKAFFFNHRPAEAASADA